MTLTPGTVRLHRVLRAPPEHVYRAFLDADALARWLPPHGFTARVTTLDPTVGGARRLTFTNYRTGTTQGFGGVHLELRPYEKIVYTDQFDDASLLSPHSPAPPPRAGNLPGVITVTVSLEPVACGTSLTLVQDGLPPSLPVEFCYLGWQESLAMLAALVEPEIPDAE